MAETPAPYATVTLNPQDSGTWARYDRVGVVAAEYQFPPPRSISQLYAGSTPAGAFETVALSVAACPTTGSVRLGVTETCNGGRRRGWGGRRRGGRRGRGRRLRGCLDLETRRYRRSATRVVARLDPHHPFTVVRHGDVRAGGPRSHTRVQLVARASHPPADEVMVRSLDVVPVDGHVQRAGCGVDPQPRGLCRYADYRLGCRRGSLLGRRSRCRLGRWRWFRRGFGRGFGSDPRDGEGVRRGRSPGAVRDRDPELPGLRGVGKV